MPVRKKSKSVEKSEEEEDFEVVESPSKKNKTNSKKKQRSASVEVVEDSDESETIKSKKAAKQPASKKAKLALDDDEGENYEVVDADEEEDEEDEGDDVYTIEKILKHRMSEETGTYEYLIRWEGYGPEDDTWEPEDHCETAPVLVGKYWKDQPTSKQPRKLQEVKKKLEKIKSPKKRGNKSTNEDASGSEGEIEDAVDLASVMNGSSKSKKRKSPHDEQREEELKARIDEQEQLLAEWNKHESWEKDVVVVETISQEDDDVLRAHLKLKNGEELWVELREAYKKCPQAMLAFYESHLRFRPNQDLD